MEYLKDPECFSGVSISSMALISWWEMGPNNVSRCFRKYLSVTILHDWNSDLEEARLSDLNDIDLFEVDEYLVTQMRGHRSILI